ncbi:MAG: hypothetical protein PHY80_02865 [Rickettsiales bacterium]|nr:hypothetical protein [Rickettsiales bacterium]
MNVLTIGLNDLSKKITEYLRTVELNVLGFDFDVDKIESFYHDNLIKNDSKIILQDLLKQADIIILNTDISRYVDIFRLSPFIKNDCLIINTNSYKNIDDKIKENLKNKFVDFLPCNFAFFPKNVIMNFDKNSKMALMHSLSLFFKNINIKTSDLTPKENNLVISKIYHIPFLLDSVLFKINGANFISNDYIFECTYEDIILNKENILCDLENLSSNFPNIRNKNETLSLLDENILLTSNKNSETDITRTIFGKILIEKLMIKLFQYRSLKTYTDNLNLGYLNYKTDFLKNYYSKNEEDIEILFLLLKEKINNLICFLEFENLTPNKLKKYLQL